MSATYPPPFPSPSEFRVLYEREFGYVWANLRRVGIPSRDLPDVTHDVFVVVFRNLSKYDDTRPFRPWLFGVLARVASDHVRLSRNRLEILDELVEPCDACPTPEAEADLRQRWRIIERALESLPLHHRVVLVMHDIAGHSAREVSRELGIPFKTVYSRLNTARLGILKSAHDMKVLPKLSPRPVGRVDLGADARGSNPRPNQSQSPRQFGFDRPG
jgi:RNA polymerase sigma-70 factor (ECF subfamily)